MLRALKGLISWLVIAGFTGIMIWGGQSRPFAPMGGDYFEPAVEYDVRQFYQNDPAWGQHPLAKTEATLAQEGCALTCAAMILSTAGVDTDPGRLNAFLNETGGYTSNGWIFWEKACEIEPGRFRKTFESVGTHNLIDRTLRSGITPILKVRAESGISHFVIVVGKEGHRYLIRDPRSSKGGRVIYLDEHYPKPVEGVRIIKPLHGPTR